jgi:hypothetical protein
MAVVDGSIGSGHTPPSYRIADESTGLLEGRRVSRARALRLLDHELPRMAASPIAVRSEASTARRRHGHVTTSGSTSEART